MRRYFFNNFYVAAVGTGIQAGHAAETNWATLVLPLLEGRISDKRREQLKMLCEFATQHGTWIVLNGGDHQALTELRDFFSLDENPFPWMVFTEPGLNNAITSVTIVVPERLYDDVADAVAAAMKKAAANSKLEIPANWGRFVPDSLADEVRLRNYTAWELEFLARKAVCGLAR